MSVRLTMAPAASQRCFKLAGGVQADCRVIERVSAAFSATAARLFLESPDPTLDIVVAVDDAKVFEHASGYLTFDIRTTARILTPQGELIDQIGSVGSVSVTADTPLANGEETAARNAADRFENAFANATGVNGYLVANHIVTTAAFAPPPRADNVFSFGITGALAQGAGDSAVSLMPGGYLAVAVRWFTLQVAYAHVGSAFQGQGGGRLLYDASLSTNDLGLEVGAVVRIRPNIEVHAGPGVHYLFGTTSAEPNRVAAASIHKLAPSVFGSLAFAFAPFRSSARLLFGFEARGYFSTTVDLPEYGRSLPLANSTFGLFFAAELGFSSRGGMQ